MKLSEFLAKYPELSGVYQVLKPYLPSEVEVYSISELEKHGYRAKSTVMGVALKPNKVFFRYIPPSPVTFAHELIHLCKRKAEDVSEEVYGYNFAELIVFMADEGIKANPFDLVRLSENQVNAVLREFGYKDIDEYYHIYGIIPLTHDLRFIEGKGLEVIRRKGVSERDIVLWFLTELVDGLPYDSMCGRILRKLLEKYC